MIDRGKGWSGGFGVLDFFIEMLASEVNCSGSLVGGACRVMEGGDATYFEDVTAVEYYLWPSSSSICLGLVILENPR